MVSFVKFKSRLPNLQNSHKCKETIQKSDESLLDSLRYVTPPGLAPVHRSFRLAAKRQEMSLNNQLDWRPLSADVIPVRSLSRRPVPSNGVSNHKAQVVGAVRIRALSTESIPLSIYQFRLQVNRREFDCTFGLWLCFRRRRGDLVNSPVHGVTSAAEQRRAGPFVGRLEAVSVVF